ncbi:MAG: FAD-dependent oxidoreductase [Candidatus Peregrinibacteria bacterium]
MSSLPNFTATVLSNLSIAQETRGLRLRIHDENFAFHAGQFINIVVSEKIVRAYSIASSPAVLPDLELCVKIIPGGMGTTYIDHLEVGDTVVFTGPFGHFGPKDSEKKKLLVATGTGIAPMKAIVDEAKEFGFGAGVHLLFGVREEAFAVYTDYFETLANSETLFSFDLCVSQGKGSTQAYAGRVTGFLAAQPPEIFTNTEVLFCGSPAMVKEGKEILMNTKGVEKGNIVVEMY